MNNLQDIQNRFRQELEQWFPKQCRNVYMDFYLYYQESTPEHDGGLLICEESPANSSYKLANPCRLPKTMTIQQVLNAYEPILRQLPVLSIRKN